MFTGLIEAVCPVRAVYQPGGTMMVTIDLGKLSEQVKVGDSIALDGVCLTVSKLQDNLATFDISGETLAKSTLGKLKPPTQVNIELAMKGTERFGGHFVLGHVDGTATIKSIDKQGQFANIKFAASPELLDQMVLKGSVAVDGISLTVANLNTDSFAVAIIPQTLERTTLGTAKIGDTVNIETDIIVKVIRKQMEKIIPQESLTAEKLKEFGF